MPTPEEYLREARLEAGLTQRQTAAALGLSLTGWLPYENAGRVAKPDLAVRIADVLEVDILWVLWAFGYLTDLQLTHYLRAADHATARR